MDSVHVVRYYALHISQVRKLYFIELEIFNLATDKQYFHEYHN